MMVSEKYRAKNADDDADQKPMKFDEVTTEEDGLFGHISTSRPLNSYSFQLIHNRIISLMLSFFL